MSLLLGALGWGLITMGAATHLWHHARLRELLAQHLDADRTAAFALVSVEVLIAALVPIAVLTGAPWLPVIAVAAAVVGLGFTAWIARLLLTGSELPCACSFSQGPTSPWSLVRAALIMLTVVFAFVDDGLSTGDQIASLCTGLAIAGAIFVVPEAVSWPPALRAQLARLDSHAPVGQR